MKPIAYFNGATTYDNQVTTHSTNVLKIEGNYRGALSTYFLQVHDSSTTPAEGSVPIKSWPLYATSPFFQTFPGGALPIANGLYICVSTTEGTKTLASTSGEVCDLFVELPMPEAYAGTTVVGDLTSAVTGLQVWSEAAGAVRKKLVRLQVDGTGLSADAFIQLFANDTTPNGTVPIACWPIADNAAVDLLFGIDGREVNLKVGNTTSLGCTVRLSSTATTLTLITAQTVTIRAEYK